jgi:hypothetical protein
MNRIAAIAALAAPGLVGGVAAAQDASRPRPITLVAP